jgi:hypothetical protein
MYVIEFLAEVECSSKEHSRKELIRKSLDIP